MLHILQAPRARAIAALAQKGRRHVQGGMADQQEMFGKQAARDTLAQRWFTLTRERLPEMAKTRDWPVSQDHCFMRILLDNACGGAWRDSIKAPAYRHAPLEVLERAVALGEQVAAGEPDLRELNARSLAWRGKG